LKFWAFVGWISWELGAFVEQLDSGTSKVLFIYLLHAAKSAFYVYFLYAQTELCCPTVGHDAFSYIHARV
jgi:hypothetical protein